jgi:hypothetical protein
MVLTPLPTGRVYRLERPAPRRTLLQQLRSLWRRRAR